MIRAIAIVALITSVAHATPLVDDPAREPYVIELGPQGSWDTADALVALAAQTSDPKRVARMLAMACFYRSAAVFDSTGKADECKRAAEGAAAHGLVDVDVYLATSRGNLQAWQLDVATSIATLQHALELGKQLDLRSDLGHTVRRAKFTLAAILIEAGKYDLAIAGLAEVEAASRDARDVPLLAWTHLWQCRARKRIGELARAREYCAQARASAERRDDLNQRINVEWIEAELADRLANHAASFALYRAAWELAQVRGHEMLHPTLFMGLIDEALLLGRIDEAAAWQAKLEAFPNPPFYLPQVALFRGLIARARNDLKAAATAFEVAITSPMHHVAISSRHQLSATRKALGDLPGARAVLEDAIARIETDRAAVGPDQRATFMALHALTYRALVGLLWDERGAAAATRALEVAEAGRARSLLDAVAMTESTTVARVVAPDEIVRQLAPDEALVELVVAADRTFAIAATRAGVVLVPLPDAGGEAALARRVSFFRQLVVEATDEAELSVPARRLFADLLAPAIAALPDRGAGIATLIISPDGPLHALPWDALADGDTFVVDRWRVSIVPSASVLARRPAHDPTSGALVVAMPETASLEELPTTEDESETIRRRIGGEVKTLVGTAATEAAITRELERVAVIHFASHAVVDPAMPLRSSLVVAAGAGGDGRLRVEEIYRLRLAADLVVLAACETGVGAVTSGEGVTSISRAFLHAGAGSTIATLWPVADAVGPAFADALYRELGAGRGILDAATAAKRTLRAAGARPADWAAYVVTAPASATARVTPGDLSTPKSSSRWPWIAGAFACGLALVVLARRRVALAVFAGVATTGAVIALVVLAGRAPDRPMLAIARGGTVKPIAITRSANTITWKGEPGTAYRASFYGADGRLIAESPVGAGAAEIPAGATWCVVEADRDGIARPALLALTAR